MFNACCRRRSCSKCKRLGELARLRDTKADRSKNFFQAMKWLTLTGYYTSEVGATTELHYRVVPGRYEPCYPLEP